MSFSRGNSTYPDEDEDFGVPDPVLPLGDPDHGELSGAGALLDQISDLQTEQLLISASVVFRAITIIPGARITFSARS